MPVYSGFKSIIKKYEKLSANAGRKADMRKPLAASMKLAVRDTKKRFNDEQSPTGEKWAPLKPVTVAARRKGKRKQRSPKILQNIGTLRQSIRSNGHQMNIYNIEKHKATFGTKIPYGPVNQYGSRSRNIPARPFIGFSKKTQGDIPKLFGIWLQRLHFKK